LLALAGPRPDAALAAVEAADVVRPAAPALLLARPWDPAANPVSFLVSEKFDGVRALWDGRQLRFRSGATIPAPAWFLARLPAQALDGELWLARGSFDALSAIVRKTRPDDAEWRQLHYLVFELPGAAGPFVERAARLRDIVRQCGWPQLEAVEQAPVDDGAALRLRLAAVLAVGGEGLVLHAAAAPYQTGRSEVLFKFKPVEDAEGQVVGH
jgi:DNA ligase-1